MSRSVAVIGGGVAGLTSAYELTERAERLSEDLDVQCLEASERAGGNIGTTREAGFLYEWAANGFLDNAPATVTLVRRLGLEDQLVRAGEDAARRFIFRRGKLREVPLTPPAFLSSNILPLAGKLRLLCEPFAPRRRSSKREESVYEFASRRIGRSAATVLVDAMASGIYAGDIRRLSLEATFPKMRSMEADHGSLFRAMLAKRKQAKAEGRSAGGPAGPGGVLTSFRGGMQQLTDALAGVLGPRLRTGTPVARLSNLGRRGFRVHPVTGAPWDVDVVVLACPAWSAAEVVRSMDAELATALADIPSAPLAVVHSGYRRDALGPKPEGFGFLVPREQGLRILGTLCSSNIFPDRAPEGSLLLTSMIGGAHDPDVIDLDDTTLLSIVAKDLRSALRIEAPCYFNRIIRWSRGIPQYELGHLQRLETVERRLAQHPGLWISGNSLRGISVNACVEEAPTVAEAALEFLNQKPS